MPDRKKENNKKMRINNFGVQKDEVFQEREKKKKECENFEEIYRKVAVVRAPTTARPLTHQGNQLYFVNYILFTLK